MVARFYLERDTEMAHMIDVSTGRAAMAYVGSEPWHGLGHALTPGASVETWTQQAGLGYSVLESAVEYQSPVVTGHQAWPDRKVLHRSDNGAPLAVVSKAYHVVQPREIMEFFRTLTDIGGFELETAGALSDGKRVWALARVADGAPVIDGDLVRPYLLLGTSYDGTMATVAKFTAIRVVCNNTITAAVGGYTGGRVIKGETETDKGYLKSAVRVLHSEKFDPQAVRLQLGIVAGAWEKFLIDSRMLASVTMGALEADQFVRQLLEPYQTSKKPIDETKGYREIMRLFNGSAIGSDILGVSGTRWGMLNAVTEMVDHGRGRSNNTRIESAWFGTGGALKARAVEMLTADFASEPEPVPA